MEPGLVKMRDVGLRVLAGVFALVSAVVFLPLLWVCLMLVGEAGDMASAPLDMFWFPLATIASIVNFIWAIRSIRTAQPGRMLKVVILSAFVLALAPIAWAENINVF